MLVWQVIKMAVTDKIQQYMRRLPAASQAEVLDFVEYLLNKAEREAVRQEERDWASLSLTSAMHGMEDEDAPTYTTSDLKTVFS
jgi:hypothetical protein